MKLIHPKDMTWKSERWFVRRRGGQWEATKGIKVSHYYFCSESEHTNSLSSQISEILATIAEFLTHATRVENEHFYYTKWT